MRVFGVGCTWVFGGEGWFCFGGTHYFYSYKEIEDVVRKLWTVYLWERDTSEDDWRTLLLLCLVA